MLPPPPPFTPGVGGLQYGSLQANIMGGHRGSPSLNCPSSFVGLYPGRAANLRPVHRHGLRGGGGVWGRRHRAPHRPTSHGAAAVGRRALRGNGGGRSGAGDRCGEGEFAPRAAVPAAARADFARALPTCVQRVRVSVRPYVPCSGVPLHVAVRPGAVRPLVSVRPSVPGHPLPRAPTPSGHPVRVSVPESVCLPLCPCVCPCVHPCVPCACLSLCLSSCLSFCLLFCPPARMAALLSVCPPF